ncbi:MAG: hypothetical protein GC190_05105 [Alphaproteobacteria bacterium]|nr:hypothetical protein [Alphaproteobacteria bacterium]
MLKVLVSALAALFFAASQAVATDTPVQVMVLGTFYLDNPGQDIANLQVDDVMTPKRQAEIGTILDGLAHYNPTVIAVESRRRQPGSLLSESYAQFLAGALPPNKSEVVQFGYRLAQRLHLPNVYAVDVEGDFPFEAVMEFAKKNGSESAINGQIQSIQSEIARQSEFLKTHSLAALLRIHNDPLKIAMGNKFYVDLLSYGMLDEQPGVAVVSSWYTRNFNICARVVQTAKPGDRVLVIFGSGHAYLLRHCFGGLSNYQLVEPNDYLPQ